MPFPSTDPTIPTFADPLQWITAYLTAHMMSDNSRRYMYVLWIGVAVFFFCAGIMHYTGTRGSQMWAYYTRWAIRRRTWRGKYYMELSRKRNEKAYPVSLPPNGQILALFTLLGCATILAFAGPDYISPSVRMFDNNPTLTARSGYDVTNYIRYQIPYSINKSWWTAGGRTGLIVFALFPLVILIVLKSRPFALIALICEIHFDKLIWAHRWIGRLIWLVTALHVGLWSVQLSQDTRDNTGKSAYRYAWLYQKFLFGWIAFGSLTLLTILSLRPLRRQHYEIFWYGHIGLVILMLIFAALHHPPVWQWCWGALGLWLVERSWRFGWALYGNGYFGVDKRRPLTVRPNSPAGTNRRSVASDTKRFSEFSETGEHSYPPFRPSTPSTLAPDSEGGRQQQSMLFINYVPPPGFAHAELLSGVTIRLTFCMPVFRPWAPGQHFLINVPSVSYFLTHPFTAASICDTQSATGAGRCIVFIIRAKDGWTRDLWDHISIQLRLGNKYPSGEEPDADYPLPSYGVIMRMRVDGPFGSPSRARWEEHSTVMICVAGSGVSFGLAILEYMCLCMAGRDGKQLGGRKGGWGTKGYAPRRIRFIWLVREYGHIQWCSTALKRCMRLVPSPGLDIDIFVTNHRMSNIPTPILRPPSMVHSPQQAPRIESTFLDPPTALFMFDDSTPRVGGRERTSMYAGPGAPVIVEDPAYVDLSYYTGEFGDEDVAKLGGRPKENYTTDLTNFDGDRDDRLPGEEILNARIRKVGLERRSRAISQRIEMEKRISAWTAADMRPSMDYRSSGLRPSGELNRSSMLRPSGELNRSSMLRPSGEYRSSILRPTTEYRDRPSTMRPSNLHVSTKRLSEASYKSSDDLLGSNRMSTASWTPYEENEDEEEDDYDQHRDHEDSDTATLASQAPYDSAKPHLSLQVPSRSASPMRPGSPDGSSNGHGDEIKMSHFEADMMEDSDLNFQEQELHDISVVAEKARPGKPKIARMLKDEVDAARGSTIVACCGPTSWNAMIRKAVAEEISPARIRAGDRRGYVELISEEFDF